MTVLSFFVAQLVTENGTKRRASLQLRYTFATGVEEAEDLLASEASLTAFCFPLGPEAAVPKEFIATEVTCGLARGGGMRKLSRSCVAPCAAPVETSTQIAWCRSTLSR